MLNRIQAVATTMVDAPRVSRTKRVARVLGTGLLGLMLSVPMSWAQFGGPQPTPPAPEPAPPAPSAVVVFEASIIAPENGQVVGADCFRLNTETGAFTSDVLSSNGFPDGYWFAVSTQDQTSGLFTAHMTGLAASSDGQTVPVTVSFGGSIGESGLAGAIVQSDGTPLAYQAQPNPACAVSAAPGVQSRDASKGETANGYGY